MLDTLTALERDGLVDFWTRAGLSEHSSIAGFNRFALDLLAHGAPAALVARAQRAALQELEHAQASSHCLLADRAALRPATVGRMTGSEDLFAAPGVRGVPPGV